MKTGRRFAKSKDSRKDSLGFESMQPSHGIKTQGIDLRIVFAEISIFKAFMKTLCIVVLFLSGIPLFGQTPKFKMQTIDDKVGIGYGVQLADMNSDGKTDILLVDKDKVAWYKNPGWKKHIVVNHLTQRDHVCLTVSDRGHRLSWFLFRRQMNQF